MPTPTDAVAIAWARAPGNPLQIEAELVAMYGPLHGTWISWGDGSPPDPGPRASHEYETAGVRQVSAGGYVGVQDTPVSASVYVLADVGAGVGPHIDRLDPNSARIGDPDLTLSVLGGGFSAESVIVWNGGDETTTFVSESEVTTTVQPSTASGPWGIPIQVRTGTWLSNTVVFQFLPQAET